MLGAANVTVADATHISTAIPITNRCLLILFPPLKMCAKYLLFKMLGESIASHGPAIRVNLPQASLYTCLNMIYRFGLHDKWLDENMQFHEKVLTVNGESMVSKPEL